MRSAQRIERFEPGAPGYHRDNAMTEAPRELQLNWHGPSRWPGLAHQGCYEDLEGAGIASDCGVYLWTVEHEGGFLIYTAGITRRPFRERFREHTREYQSGVYTIFDVPSLMRGERKKIWPGFWYRKRPPALEQEYERRKPELIVALDALLSAYRVFVAPLPPVPRVLKRVEAGIMNALYAAGGAASAVPDRGMALSPRWDSESPLLVRNTVGVVLHGMPLELEV